MLTGAAEIGQGSSTVLVQSVAEVLGLDLSRIRIVTGDSDVVPKDNGSYSSRVTFMVGNAAIDAAQQSESACWSRRRRASSKPSRTRSSAWASSIAPARRTRVSTFDEVVTEALKDTGTITVTGNYSTIPESHGGKKYRGAAIGGTMGYSYSAQVVEVSVDEETGVVTVDKVWVAHDCGKALNRLTVEGQVQGSVWMGMGQAMSEEAAYHDGLLLTANMLDYRVPTIQDSPPIEVGIVESNDPHGPFGAKEAGEGSLAAFLPALTNAIADATGLRFNDLPVTPDRVFAAIEKRRRARPRGGKAQRRRLMDALPSFELSARHARRVARGARGTSRQAAARRRHRPHGEYPPRHRRAAGARSTSTAWPSCARIKADARCARDRRRGHARRARRASRRGAALSGGGAGRRPSSPARPIATWARSAAISASTPAASSTIRANGGAPPITIASRPPATSATSRRRAAASASPPSAAIWRRRC